MKTRSMGENAVLNGLKALLSVIFPLITYPYALRVLQVENIGKVDFSNSIINYFVLLAGLGINTYAIREGAIVRDDEKKLSEFSSQIFSINVISTIVAYIALGITLILSSKLKNYELLLAVQSITLLGNLLGVLWLYSIVEDYRYIAIRSLAVHIIALFLMFIFVRNRDDYVFYAGASVVANAGANFFNIVHSRKYTKIRFTTKMNLRKHLAPIMIIFASSVSSTIYVNSDKTILGYLLSDYYVGLYSSAVNIYTVLKICMMSVIQVSLPRLTNYLANNRRDDYLNSATDIFKMFTVVLFPIVVGIFAIADDAILIVGGRNYLPATSTLRILSISLVFSIFATFYTNAVLLPFKKENIVLIASICSALINVAINFLIIPSMKQDGAALTTLLAEIAMFLIQYIYAKRFIRIKTSASFIGSIILGCGGIILVATITDVLISSFIINLIVKILGSVLVYGMAMIIFKNDAAKYIIEKYIHKNDKQ